MKRKPRRSTYLVLVTFDLHGAKPSAYSRVQDRLAKLDFDKVIQSRTSGRLRSLPANTFVATFDRLLQARSSPIRDQIRDEVKKILRQERLRADVFVTVGQRWAWGTARV